MAFLSGVRGRSRSLLLSAFFAVSVSCGLGTVCWAWLDAAPASAQPLAAVAPIGHSHPTGHGAPKSHGNGKTNANSPGNGKSQTNGTSQSNGTTQSNPKAHGKGHSAQAPGHNKNNKAPAPQTLNPQVAAPRKARAASPQPTPAAAAPPSQTPAPVPVLDAIALRVGRAALDLTGAPAGALRSGVAGTALEAVIPGAWLPGSSFYRRELGLLNGTFSGLPLQVARKLKVPIALLLGGALFLLIQALVDRRDPKVSLAPEHGQEDSLDFQ